MTVQEIYQRYPKIDGIVSLGNESREHSPAIARICDFLAGLCVDLLPVLPPPVVAAVAEVAPPPAPAPGWVAPPVGTPGLSQGWPQPVTVAPAPAPPPAPTWVPGTVAPVPAPADDKAEIRALLAALAAKL